MALQFPNQTYWNIIHIAEDILICCEQKSIIVWPEYGTLLGMKRHGGSIIPWTNRGFFGMFEKDRDRFIEMFMKVKSNDLIIDIGYYCDNGCLTIYPTENHTDMVNVIFYEQTNDSVKTLQNSITEEQHPDIIGNCYQNNMFLQPIKSFMLGHNVYIPNQCISILESQYDNWRDSPYEYRDYIIDKYMSSPFKDLECPQCVDFNAYRSLIENADRPFVIKESSLIACSTDQYQDIIDAQRTDFALGTSFQESVIVVWQRFLEKSLRYDIIDSTVDDKSILSEEWINYYHEKHSPDDTMALLWKMINKPNISKFYSYPSMGRFIKVLHGEMIFWIISPDDYEYLNHQGYNINFLSGLRMYQLLKLANGFLYGKIMITHLTNGDLIYLPAGYLWRELTIDNTYGFSGHL